MFAARRSAVTLIAALAAASSATAQTRAFASTPVAATRAVDDASKLFEEGRLKDAKKAYERAASDARAQGEYAKDAFAGLANVQFALEDIKGAARAFDELGERAATFGDPETEITAFFNAALLYSEAGDKRSAALRVPKLKTLLQSPVISEATRRMVVARIAK